MIQKPNPNKIQFLTPEIVTLIDKLTEPTVENIGAINLTGDIIPSGSVLAGVGDGLPDFRPQIGTDLVRGADSDFSENTGNWDTDADVSIVGGKLVFNGVLGNDGARITIPLAAGETYKTEYVTVNATNDSFRIVLGGTNGDTELTADTFTQDIVAGGTGVLSFEGIGGDTEVDILSVTVRHKATWRIDTALERRPRRGLDFALLATHNLLDVYESTIRSIVDFFSAPTDVLPTDPIEASRIISGLLGGGGPYLSFDGVDDYVSVADSSNINFGQDTNFSIGIKGLKTTDAGAPAVLDKGQFGVGRYVFFIDSGGLLNFAIDDGGATTVTTTTVVNDGVKRDVLVACDRNGNMQIYLDNVVDGAAVDISGKGDIDDATEPLTFGIRSENETSDAYNGDMSAVILWNMVLSTDQRTAWFNGEDIPVADRDASNTNLLTNGDFSATGAGVFDNDPSSFPVSGEVDVNTRIFADGTSVRVVSSAGVLVFMQQNVGINIGERYRIETKITANSAPGITISDALGTNFTAVTYTATGNKIIEFIATGATVGLQTKRAGSGTDTTILTQKLVRVGTVAAYQHDGISVSQQLWLDVANGLHGTINGADIWNAPTSDKPGYYLKQFATSVLDRYLFNKFNPDALTALDAAFMGWIVWGSTYNFNFDHGSGYDGNISWPGMQRITTESGVVYIDKKFGLRPSWRVKMIAEDDAGWQDIQDFISKVDGAFYPFYMIWDSDDIDPVLYQVRLTGQVTFIYGTGEHSWKGIVFNIASEGM